MNPAPHTIPSTDSLLSKIEKMPRRVERRFAHRVPCRVRTSEPQGEPNVSTVGQTVNLSPNGVAVQLSQPLAAGVGVEVYLPHIDGLPILLRGKVIHSRRVMTGTFEIGIHISPPRHSEDNC